jgi:hypothetical protein
MGYIRVVTRETILWNLIHEEMETNEQNSRLNAEWHAFFQEAFWSARA